jgi:general L-amino acid transport system ATP-binding protein
MTDPIIRFTGVNKWFDNGLHVLRDIGLAIAPGERIVVCGPSGSGKSTLIRCINGLEAFQEGGITVAGHDLAQGPPAVAAVRRLVGMVFQQFNLFPHLTVLENLTLAPMLVGGLSREDAHACASPNRRPSTRRSCRVASSSGWRSRAPCACSRA